MIDETNKITAPFTYLQVESINDYQQSGAFHPFTCPRNHMSVQVLDEEENTVEHLRSEDEISKWEQENRTIIWEDHVCLVAKAEYLYCPAQTCDYTQDWVWDFMADRPSWVNQIIDATK